MNKDEFQGGVRYAGGKVEKAVGDVVDSRDWKVAGLVDQVAGGVQHTYGRARSIVEDAIDSAPDLADEARDRLKNAGERVADGAQRGGKVAARAPPRSAAKRLPGSSTGAATEIGHDGGIVQEPPGHG